ncbi:hypothetical protein [Paenibacillus spongiae]|uniref:Uncharacterized protein n=1 Tax=Paenibacillus spongiae TaxID=2909671 RepID=A0ABY5S696_9BACL|nr:hypothetical protein [Paenibacillus spongiae]UVI28377.1 hypothetical protein L1F29_23385 [Paenibacillus spongiae]
MKTWKGLLLTFMLAAFTLLAAVPAMSVSARMSEDPVDGGGYGGGTGGSIGGSTSSSSTVQTIPSLTAESAWQSSNGGRYMYTRATLQRSGALAGQLDVVTRTKNNVKLTGFTGGVFLLLRTADGAVIGVTDQQKFGVDGQWIGRYDRTDYWSWSFDPQVAAATAYIEIIQQHSAKDLDDQLAYWQSTVCGNLDRLGLPKPPYGCG